MTTNSSFKRFFINATLFISFFTTYWVTNKISPDFLSHILNGEFTPLITFFVVFGAHIILVVFLMNLFGKEKNKLADSQLLKPNELIKEQKKMQNEGVFLVKPKRYNKKHPYYTDTSALPLSRNVKLSTKASYTHTILFGPTGSGKSAAYFIPILRNLDGNSIVVTDPKGELHAKTRDYLLYKGYEVLHLNFNDPRHSDSYSLLGNCIDHSDVTKLAESIMGQGSGGGDSDNWAKMSKPLFAAFLFHEFDKGSKSMSNVVKHMGEVGANAEQLEMFFKLSSPKAKEAYRMFKGSMGSEATVGSIFTTINGKIEVFTYDKVQRLSESSSFSADNFRLGKAALFVSYPEDESVVYAPYIASFFYQLMSSIKAHPSMYEGSRGKKGNGVHFLLDEFANIGTLPELDTFLSTIRSKEMSIMLGIQSFDQIKVRYKDRTNTIVENCKTKIVLPGTTGETAKFFSDLVGEEEYNQLSTSSSKSSDTSTSSSKQKKMILSQDQIRRMRTHDVIFISDNLKPTKDVKNLYYLSDFEQKILESLPFSPAKNLSIAKKIADTLGKNKAQEELDKAVKKHGNKVRKLSAKQPKELVVPSTIPKAALVTLEEEIESSISLDMTEDFKYESVKEDRKNRFEESMQFNDEIDADDEELFDNYIVSPRDRKIEEQQRRKKELLNELEKDDKFY